MTTQAIETATRRVAATVTHRAALQILSGAAVTAAVVKPGVSEAKKGGQSYGKNQKKQCQSNKTQCENSVTASCNGDQVCLGQFLPCCDECFSNAFLTSLIANQP
jgi:hypothetical protein